MATIGRLTVDLQANSAAFSRDMSKAQRSMQTSSARINRHLLKMDKSFKKVSKSIKAKLKSVFSLRGAIATLTGSAGLGLLVKKSLDFADAIGKTADKIGVSTSELQEYQFAASLAGVKTETLNMGLQRFTRRVAEAAQGKGELLGVLKQYNIATTDAEGRTRKTSDVMDDLADVIKNTSSGSERLRIAFKAFDSEGVAMVNMLRNGSAGLNKFRQEAHDLGIVMDESFIRAAENANDQMGKLARVIGKRRPHCSPKPWCIWSRPRTI
jgi:hypothetical protein